MESEWAGECYTQRVGHRACLEGMSQAARWTIGRKDTSGEALLTSAFTVFLPTTTPLLDQSGTCRFCVYALR